MFAKYFESAEAAPKTAIIIDWPTPNRATLQVFHNDQNGSELKQDVPSASSEGFPVYPNFEVSRPVNQGPAVPDENVEALTKRVDAIEELLK